MARQERIRKNAELNYQKAHLPERMEMHEQKKKQEPPKETQGADYAFRPTINDLVTAEQFKKAQHKFNEKLNKKKSQKVLTRPKSPDFHKSVGKPL